MAYEDFKGLAIRTASDRVLHDKAFNVANNLQYHGYQHCFTSTFYKIYDKKKRCGIKSNVAATIS